MSTYISNLARENGLRLVDARSSLDIELTDRDIKKGKVKDPKCCALSLAARRADSNVRAAYFFKTTAWLEYDDRLVRYVLPPSVQKEIVSFDRAQIMASGSYHLAKPSKSTRMTAVRARSAKRPGRHQPANTRITRKVRHHVTTLVRDLQETFA